MANSFLGIFRGANQDDPLTNVKSVNAWVAGLPAKDPLGTLEAVIRVLENMGTTQPEITASRALALLTLDRLSLPMQADVQHQYRLPAVSENVRRRLWHACNDLARWFAYAYEQVYAGIAGQANGKSLRVPIQGIFSRLFYYRGLQAKLGLLLYERWIPGSWKFLHNAYREACARGVATEPFALVDPAGPGDRFSAEEEFLQLLLLQRINSGDLNGRQVEWAAQWLRSWVRALKLTEPPARGDGYWLDLGKGEGLVAKRPASPSGDVLYLDVEPLHEQLGALIARLGERPAANGGGAKQPEVRAPEEQLKLAMRLDDLWRPQAKQRERRGERHAEHRSVAVAAGWTGIIAAMRSAAHKPHEPHQYSYDDAAHLVALGYVPNVQRDQYGNAVQRAFDRREWQLHDTSESGVRIQSATREAQQQQIGALIALQPDGDTRWWLGIARRLHRRTTELTELGVEIIARNAIMLKASLPAARDSGYSVDGIDIASANQNFSVLYLPPQQHGRFTPVRSVVLPAKEYAAGRILSINVDGVNHEIRLRAPLEQAMDWVWTEFESPTAAKVP